jgi:hypothetical protein
MRRERAPCPEAFLSWAAPQPCRGAREEDRALVAMLERGETIYPEEREMSTKKDYSARIVHR